MTASPDCHSMSQEPNTLEEAEDEEEEDEDIQISLAPYVQTYLAAHSGRSFCCCCFPPVAFFERSSNCSWWNPRFDSEILEGQYWRSSFPQVLFRFRSTLVFVIMICMTLGTYIVACGAPRWSFILAGLLGAVVTAVLLLGATYCRQFSQPNRQIFLSIGAAFLLICLSLGLAVGAGSVGSLSPVALSSLCAQTLLLLYTAVPLPLYACVAICTLYSITFEIILAVTVEPISEPGDGWARGLAQLCLHVIGVHALVMRHVRSRGTFIKVGQALLVRRQLEAEKQLKEKMILSVMPPKVADWLMREGSTVPTEVPSAVRPLDSENEDGDCDDHDEQESIVRKASSPRSSNPGDIRHSLFRPFNMHRMEDVSILFADIVGFTRMSSNKSAEQLVGLLNDLFERFDGLCAVQGCEKISTLGDCYYCVSGCPEPVLDHAKRCVEVGRGMIVAVIQFDQERHEDVSMRVGVHTGTILCGIVGTMRFKFDVWSNDVTLANQMESTGRPGRVHISETTYQFLGDLYDVEEGEDVQGLKTYFIIKPKSETDEMLKPEPLPVPLSSPLLPPSPQRRGPSLPAPPLAHRLELSTQASPFFLRSKKACSLPSILDSENGMNRASRCRQEDPSYIYIGEGSLGRRGTHHVQGTSRKSRFHSAKADKGLNRLTSNPNQGESSIPLRHSSPFKRGTGCGDVGEVTSMRGIARTVDESGDGLSPSSQGMRLEVPVMQSTEDQLSMSLSMNSRKDSGVRSTSRRSSIQQQIYAMNGIVPGSLLTHRVSGYYTSSQSSVTDSPGHCHMGMQRNSQTDDNEGHGTCDESHLHENLPCFHSLRKQSDLQLIRCVRDVSSHSSYFATPPLCQFTLFFKQAEMEREFRTHAHLREEDTDSPPTLASSRFNTCLDVAVAAAVWMMMVITQMLLPLESPSIIWIFFTVLGSLLLLMVLTVCIFRSWKGKFNPLHQFEVGYWCNFTKLTAWYYWHICGAFILNLPAVSILANFTCSNLVLVNQAGNLARLLFVSLVHFCNFTQLSCWLRSILATIVGFIYIGCIASRMCEEQDERNSSLPWTLYFSWEILPDVLLLLALIWFLDREFEVSYRLGFHGSWVAARDKARVQSMRDQADWLLHNIIPRHVVEQLKTTARYSENHKEVGVLFGTIVNFGEMYDESYLGGREYLRVLNELVGDFDELLQRPEFSEVEKIKTIGSTFMAASGLNPQRRSLSESHRHLFQLIEFALAMQEVIAQFNRYLLEFELILRIGYNHGDVTAGVIGTSKLYYDIWGDAVNVASRMDSTGVEGRIQVGEACLPVLSERYEFEPRGSVYVKGKDHMNVFLFKGHKNE